MTCVYINSDFVSFLMGHFGTIQG